MGSGPVRPADEHARALGGQQVRVGEMGGFQGGGEEGLPIQYTFRDSDIHKKSQ